MAQQIKEQVPTKRRTTRQAQDEERWNALSTLAAIDGIEKDFHSSPVDYSKKKGSLVVIGSGIKCVGQFSLEAISHLKNADKVLYCVADPATEHFIRELCPDALDLYVFYANGKKRYETYIQMAEATLYYARQGLRTVMVFYGHPGIFVMPSHRAIKIAQQQGIETYMLPAISAFDCLVADLGIDPSYPGMMTLEATDLLLRNRTLLTDMHVILWQVGCVGDLGFNRTGFKNQHLPVLIEHLQGIYGKDFVITHYIGAQYPMCSPTIAKLPLSKILEPDTIKSITGISTFYIPPKEPKESVQANAKRLGLTPKSGKPPLVRQYAQCGPQEKKAIHDLLEWTVPPDYNHFTFTKVGEYLGKLAQDVGLLHKHKKAPVKTMKDAGLATKEVSTMLKASQNQVRMLMKSDADSIATQVALRLMTDPKFASGFYDTVKKYQDDPNGETQINGWLAIHGFATTLTDIQAAFKELQKTSLLPWTSTYNTDHKDIKIIIQGQTSLSLGKVWVNNTPITKFKFANETLTWSSSDGNSSSASLAFVDGGDHNLSFSGKYWTSGNKEPTSQNISGQNATTQTSLSSWVGSYATTLDSKTGPEVEITAVQGNNYIITVGGTEICHYRFNSHNAVTWSDFYNDSNAAIVFDVENPGTSKVRRTFSGFYWKKGSSQSQNKNFSGTIDVSNFKPYIGMYRSFVFDSQGKRQYGDECFLASKSSSVSFTIGATAIKSPMYSNSTITWSTSGGNADNGVMTFYIDPQKHTAGFSGKRWTNKEPSTANFLGTFDTTYLKEWAGVYTTSILEGSLSPGAQIVVNSAATPKDIEITYGGTAIKSPVFNNPILTWSKKAGNPTNAKLTFYYSSMDSTVPLFYGKVWLDTEPTDNNFQGGIDSQYLRSWTGTYTTYKKDSNGKYTIDGPKVIISGALTESASSVTVDGTKIINFMYSTEREKKNGFLKWNNIDNATGGYITFFLSKSSVRSFCGYYWKKGESKPSNFNWLGNTDKRTPQSQGSQLGGFWSSENVNNNVAMGIIVMSIIETMKLLWKSLVAGGKAVIKYRKRLKLQEEKADEQQKKNNVENETQEGEDEEGQGEEGLGETTTGNAENNVENDVENNVENDVENNVENSVENSVEVDTTDEVVDMDVVCNIL